MALVLANRVQETTTTTGTGTITLAGAVAGFQSFAVIGNGNTTYYTITSGTAWEVGIGTYSTAGPTLARTTILSSSAGGAAITLAGTSAVFVTYPSDRAVTTDGTETLTNKTINGSNNTITNVSLTSAVTGTLPVANGGTGVTTSTGTTSVVLSNSPTLVTPTLGVASATSIATGLGAVGTPSYTFTGDANTGMWSPAADTIAFSTNGSERMRIASDGTMTLNVGGVSSTHSFLYNESGGEIQLVDSTGAGPILLDNISGLARLYKVGTGAMSIGTTGANYLQYVTNSTERMRIDSSGNVGIGTSSPGAKLDVRSANIADGINGGVINAYSTTAQAANIGGKIDLGGLYDGSNSLSFASVAGRKENSTSGDWSGYMQFSTRRFGADFVERMRIDSSGNVGIGTSAPGVTLDIAGDTLRLTRAANPPAFLGRQSQGTLAAPTATVSGDQITAFGGFGYTGAAYTSTPASAMRFLALETFTSTANGSGISFETTPIGSTTASRTERMRITSAGNVGIGASSPAGRLAVAGTGSGSTSPEISFENQTATTGRTYAIISGDGGPFRFQDVTAGAERMRIASDGNVGIGTTSPASLLHVKRGSNAIEVYPTGTSATRVINATDAAGENGLLVGNRWAGTGSTVFEAGSIFGGGTGSWYSYYRIDGTGQSFWSNGGTERMRLDTSGNVGIGTSSPGARLNVVGTNEFTLGFLAQTSSTQTTITNHPVALLYNSSTAAGNGAGLRYQIADTTGNGQVAGGTGMVATAKTSSTVTADMYFYTGTSERMRITSAGNVGIGTTAPGFKLDVNGTGYFNSSVQFFQQDGFRFTSASAVSAMRFGSAFTGESTAEWAYDRAAGATTLSQGATGSALNERMRITSAGNVGIGTSAPSTSQILTLNSGGTATPANGGLAGLGIINTDVTASGTTGILGNLTDPGGTGRHAAAIAFGKDGTWTTGSAYPGNIQFWTRPNSTASEVERMRIDSSGNVGIGTTSPGKKLDLVGQFRASGSAASGYALLEYGTSATATNNWHSGSEGDGTFRWYNGNFGAGTERMRITSGGNVGIGTSAPSFAKLQVSNAGAEGFEFSPAASAGVNRILSYNRTTNAWNTLRLEGSSQEFYVSGIERMRVASSGNVGIGTSAPSYTLQVNAASGGNQVAYFVNDSAASTLAGIASSINGGGNNTNSFHFAGVTQTVAIWYLYGNGTTSYTSDIRVKKNVTTTRDGYLEDVCKLRVVKYNWYNDSDDTPRELGFIAQEVEQVFPGLVQDAMHPTKDGEIHKVLKGSVMMPIMLKALQEANAKIDALTARVAQLEGN